jgi:predicted dehydrogenase
MRIGFVGCGFVADFYMTTLPNHPELELIGVYDRNPERLQIFSKYHSLPTYNSLDEMLADERLEIVLNLTNPREHFDVSKAALEAGKHVYSEKPLAMKYEDAKELVRLANEKGLRLASAPCNYLSESAQTVWHALREKRVGNVLLVYAEMDGNLVPRMSPEKWISVSGAPWNVKDEFEVGCTVEHAGYYLTWLTMFFGPAKTVTSFSSVRMPDKGLELDYITPDYSTGFIEFESGVVARLTNSIIADHDHTFKIIGDEAQIIVDNGWRYDSQVYIQKRRMHSRLAEIKPLYKLMGYGRRKYPMKRYSNPNYKRNTRFNHIMDYIRGVAEMAASIRESRPSYMSAEHALHITEITLTLQYPELMGSPRQIESTFPLLEPLGWAR